MRDRRWRRQLLAWAAGVVLAACGGGGGGTSAPMPPPIVASLANIAPTLDALLSPGNATGGDEDPTVALTSNAINVVWFSERNGNQASDGVIDRELFLLRSSDGRTFSGPMQITDAPRFSFAPRVAADASDRLHLVWWRVIPQPDGCVPGVNCGPGTVNKVFYKRSSATGVFVADQEQVVADGPGDWLPSVVVDRRNEEVRVFFASPVRDANGANNLALSTLRIFTSTFDGTNWSAPRMVQGVSVDTSHNTYPQIAQRDDNSFVLVWTRYALGNRNFDPNQVIDEPTAETWYGESTDGVSFTNLRALSNNTVTDALPMVYRDRSGILFAVWQSGTGGAVETALSGANAFQQVARAELAGAQPQVLATPTPGVFLGVYVNATAGRGREKIHFRFFQK